MVVVGGVEGEFVCERVRKSMSECASEQDQKCATRATELIIMSIMRFLDDLTCPVSHADLTSKILMPEFWRLFCNSFNLWKLISSRRTEKWQSVDFFLD